MMCPMTGDNTTPSVIRGRHPSHHSGPGYAEHPIAREFEQGDEANEAAARWLDYVPTEHRHRGAESGKRTLETLQDHMHSCSEHPPSGLVDRTSPPEGPIDVDPGRVARARLGGALAAGVF